MNLCWARDMVTAREIWELASEKDWNYQTVKTMLDRLVSKGYLAMSKDGTICVYEPLVRRSAALSRAIEDFVSTVLDDTMEPFLVHLAKSGKVTERELETLRREIEERERAGGSGSDEDES